MIYKDANVDNSATLKSYFSESDAFYVNTLNEIAENRDKYTYGDLNAFISRYSLYNDAGKFTEEDTPAMINAWLNVLNTAQSQEEIDKIVDRQFRNPDEDGMLTLSEAIYTYLPENASELAGKMLEKEAEVFKGKTDPADFGVSEERAHQLVHELYGFDLNGELFTNIHFMLEAIVNLKDNKISNNELLYLLQNYTGGDISKFIEQTNYIPEDVQKAVLVILQEAYKDDGNAYELLGKVSRSGDDREHTKAKEVADSYAETIKNYMTLIPESEDNVPSADGIDGTEGTDGTAGTENPEGTEGTESTKIMEPIELSGPISDNTVSQDYLNKYQSLFSQKETSVSYKEDISSLINDIISDNNISISDKMKLLNEIKKNDADI